MPNIEAIKDTLLQFKKLQQYMQLAQKEQATETYESLMDDYLTLKESLNAAGVDLTNIDKPPHSIHSINRTSISQPALSIQPDIKTSNRNMLEKIISENPFEREIQSQLLDWKMHHTNTILQLEGPRQIGKTTELQKFAYNYYEYIIYVDLSNDIYRFIDAAKHGCSPGEIDKYCQRASLPPYTDNNSTILIIDEIQNSSIIYNSIRMLHAQLHCDIIVTGSYLGRILGNDNFFLPAGTISYAYMFPLSYKEFCKIYQCDTLLNHISLCGKDDPEKYDKLNELYQIYLKIGGYPEVIKKYLETQNINECYSIIRKLLNTFKDESRNYFKSAREVEIFDSVYREALKEMCFEKRGSGKNSIERITSLTKKNTDLLVSKREVANAVIWLRYAGILGTCNLACDGDMRNIAPDKRIYFSDCGIASYLAANSLLDPTSLAGMITETFVYNELHRLYKAPYPNRKVIDDEVCFSIYKDYELDFMIADKDKVIYGIEVKTKDGYPASLHVFIDKRLVDKGILAKQTFGGHNDKFDTIPIYTVGCRFPYN